MATERIIKSDTCMSVEIDLAAGEITVEAAAEFRTAEVVIRTADDDGPSADAVNSAKVREYQHGVLGVRVKTPTVSVGGAIFNSNGGVTVVGNLTGGVVISGGEITINGRRVTADDRGGMVLSQAPSKIQVIVRMPLDQTLNVDTTSASLLAEGTYDKVSIGSVSGAIEVENSKTLFVDTTSSFVKAHRITGKARFESVSGPIKVKRWSGSEFNAKTVSGPIQVVGTDAASGSLDARTVSGSISLVNTGHLNVKTRTVSGQVSERG